MNLKFYGNQVKGEINFWYVLSYLKGIQDVSVFVSAVVSILIFLETFYHTNHSFRVLDHYIYESLNHV